MSGLAFVLSGGGARGAYEVGVLSYIFQELKRVHGCPPIDFICSTSVGAVNGTFLAGVADNPCPGIEKLVDLWTNLELAHVLEFGVRQLTGLHRVLLGGSQARGIFDASPLAGLVSKSIAWRRLRRNLSSSKLHALTITATHVATGLPVVFVDRCPNTALPRTLPAHILSRSDRITPEHVLASAAIPLVFPPIRIHNDLFCDGGLRLNTPMAPAIHLGADRLLVITVSSPTGSHITQPVPSGRFPGAPFLLGKVLNAFLLDHVHNDLETLRHINEVLADGVAACGDDFMDKMNAVAAAKGHHARQLVTPFAVHPSVDLGQLAADHLRTHQVRFGRALGRTFLERVRRISRATSSSTGSSRGG